MLTKEEVLQVYNEVGESLCVYKLQAYIIISKSCHAPSYLYNSILSNKDKSALCYTKWNKTKWLQIWQNGTYGI